MDSMEFNKIAAGVIGAGLLYLLLNFFSTAIYGTGGFAEHAQDEEHGPVLAYAVAIEGAAAGAAEEEPQIDLLALFQQADAGAGESAFRACGACHAVEPGVNKVGPTLHDVVGAEIAAVDGFNYSDALAGMEGHWTPERLSEFLQNPQAFAPGTKMSYAGMDDPEDRANVIAYLNQTGDSPIDLTEGLEPLETAQEGESTPGLDMPPPEATPGVGPGQDPREPAGGAGAADAPQEDAAGEAVPVVTPEAATETTSTTTSGQIEVEVTDTEIVDVGEEDVEVESTTPLEIVEERGPDTVADPEAQRVLPEGDDADAPATDDRAGDADAPAAQPPAGTETAMAAGDPGAGERLFRRCAACHALEEGQNRVGPHLAGIVGREVASVEGFDYSDALREHGGEWTPERLSDFLADPKTAVPGNKMAFPGLRDEQDRLDLVTYLQQAGG